MSRGSSYCRGSLKRGMDLAISSLLLVVLAPVFALLYLILLVSSGPPVLFVQERVGLSGRPFKLVKFRTMRVTSEGLPLTGTGDPRVTRIGRFLRASKLDELPQLVNVLRGEMSLVGPRPEIPRYVAQYTEVERRVLETRPGLTDPATVLFRDEEALLGAVPEEKREAFYLETVLPRKLRMNLEYVDNAAMGRDMILIVRTLLAILRLQAG
jgi:lipopolysaccharide/colanic/teichoic acid biosynthesis glycosyltransferase